MTLLKSRKRFGTGKFQKRVRMIFHYFLLASSRLLIMIYPSSNSVNFDLRQLKNSVNCDPIFPFSIISFPSLSSLSFLQISQLIPFETNKFSWSLLSIRELSHVSTISLRKRKRGCSWNSISRFVEISAQDYPHFLSFSFHLHSSRRKISLKIYEFFEFLTTRNLWNLPVFGFFCCEVFFRIFGHEFWYHFQIFDISGKWMAKLHFWTSTIRI